LHRYFGVGVEDRNVVIVVDGVGQHRNVVEFVGSGAGAASGIGAGEDGAGQGRSLAVAEVEVTNLVAAILVELDAVAGGGAVVFVLADDFDQALEARKPRRDFSG
jgi:hypothetical protein